MKSWAFGLYSWVTNIGWMIMDVLPPILRNLVFKCMLGDLGTKVMIDYHSYFRYAKRIHIGNNVSINRGCKFFASHYFPDVKISIENNVAIAPGVCFFAAGHDYSKLNLPDTAGSIKVEDNVWIGANSVLLQGITIGEGAVVASGSVVTSDIPKWTVAAGIPAKAIKARHIEQD